MTFADEGPIEGEPFGLTYYDLITGLKQACASLVEEETGPDPKLIRSVHLGDPVLFGGKFPALCFTRFRWLEDRRAADEVLLPSAVEGQVVAYHPSIRSGSSASGSPDARMRAEEKTLEVFSAWLSRLAADLTLCGMVSGVRVSSTDAGEADRFGNPFLDERNSVLFAHQGTIRIDL